MKSGLLCMVLLSFALLGVKAVCAADLTIGTVGNPPTTGADGEPAYLKEIFSKAAQRLGKTVRFENFPSLRSLHLANEGVTDGELTRIGGLEKHYPNLIRVQEPIWRMQFTGFVLNGQRLDLTPLELKDMRIGYIRGWEIFEHAFELHTKKMELEDVTALFRSLKSRRIDVAMYSLEHGIYHAQIQGISAVPLISPYAERETFVYLHQKHYALVEPLAEKLKEMKLDGTYETIIRRVVGTYTLNPSMID